MRAEKIRVLQLLTSFGMGGAERIVVSLATNTHRTHFEVIPCAWRYSGPIEVELKAASIDYRVLGLSRRSILTGPLFLADLMRILNALTRVLRELSIDVLHAHNTPSTLLGMLAIRHMSRRTGPKKRPRLCTTVHSITLHTQRGFWSPREWCMRIGTRVAFSRSDRIVAVSEEVARAVQLYTGLPRERITTVPNGIDTDRFRLQEDRYELRHKLNLPKDRRVLVAIGRLVRPKGYSYLLDALASMPPIERPLTLIVGDGPDRHDLELRAAALKLSHDIRFLGTRHDIPALLAVADIFVLASLWEGIPLALLEAMASGLPSVVTAVGGNLEVIENGTSGLLVPAADAQALAEAIRSLLQDPCQRHRLGQAARERCEHHFSLRRFIGAHEHLYEEILTERPKYSDVSPHSRFPH